MQGMASGGFFGFFQENLVITTRLQCWVGRPPHLQTEARLADVCSCCDPPRQLRLQTSYEELPSAEKRRRIAQLQYETRQLELSQELPTWRSGISQFGDEHRPKTWLSTGLINAPCTSSLSDFPIHQGFPAMLIYTRVDDHVDEMPLHVLPLLLLNPCSHVTCVSS